MRKILLASACLLSLVACDRLKNIGNISFVVPNTQTVKVEGLPGNPPIPPAGITTSIPTIGVPTQSEQYIKQNNTSSDLMREVKLSKLNLEMVTPASQDFDLVDSIWLYISAPGLEEKLAAYKFNVPKDARSIEMDKVDLNLKDYFLQDSMYFRLQGHFYDAPDSTTTMTINSEFSCLANPFQKE